MKTVKLIKEQMKNPTKESGFDSTADMLNVCLEAGGTQGVNLAQLKSRLKISEILETAEEELQLEDSDAKILLECISSMIWARFNKETARFCIDVEEQLK